MAYHKDILSVESKPVDEHNMGPTSFSMTMVPTAVREAELADVNEPSLVDKMLTMCAIGLITINK
jgi:hypothetical protein